MFARIENAVLVAYPVDPRSEQPDTSFPWDWQGGVVNGAEYALVRPSDVPAVSGTQKAVQAEPALIDGVWTQVWTVVDLSPEEREAALAMWRRTRSVTPLQIRRALRQMGMLDDVTAFVEASSVEVREAWEYAVQIDRTNELIAAAAASIGATDEDVDELFRLAATL